MRIIGKSIIYHFQYSYLNILHIKTKKATSFEVALFLKIFIDYFLKPSSAMIALYLAISLFLR